MDTADLKTFHLDTKVFYNEEAYKADKSIREMKFEISLEQDYCNHGDDIKCKENIGSFHKYLTENQKALGISDIQQNESKDLGTYQKCTFNVDDPQKFFDGFIGKLQQDKNAVGDLDEGGVRYESLHKKNDGDWEALMSTPSGHGHGDWAVSIEKLTEALKTPLPGAPEPTAEEKKKEAQLKKQKAEAKTLAQFLVDNDPGKQEDVTVDGTQGKKFTINKKTYFLATTTDADKEITDGAITEIGADNKPLAEAAQDPNLYKTFITEGIKAAPKYRAEANQKYWNSPLAEGSPNKGKAFPVLVHMCDTVGVMHELEHFSKRNGTRNTAENDKHSDTPALSASLFWSGDKGYNVPMSLYKNQILGIVLDPNKLNIGFADFRAHISYGMLPGQTNKDTRLNLPKTVAHPASKYKTKKAQVRDDKIATDISRWQRTGPSALQQGEWHEEASFKNAAEATWRTYHKTEGGAKVKKIGIDGELETVRKIKKGVGAMTFNEALCTAKEGSPHPVGGIMLDLYELKNPTSSIDFLSSIKWDELAALLEKNPSLKIYLYERSLGGDDKEAEETDNIVRVVEGDRNTLIQQIKELKGKRKEEIYQELHGLFKTAQPFKGFDEPVIEVPTVPQETLSLNLICEETERAKEGAKYKLNINAALPAALDAIEREKELLKKMHEVLQKSGVTATLAPSEDSIEIDFGGDQAARVANAEKFIAAMSPLSSNAKVLSDSIKTFEDPAGKAENRKLQTGLDFKPEEIEKANANPSPPAVNSPKTHDEAITDVKRQFGEGKSVATLKEGIEDKIINTAGKKRHVGYYNKQDFKDKTLSPTTADDTIVLFGGNESHLKSLIGGGGGQAEEVTADSMTKNTHTLTFPITTAGATWLSNLNLNNKDNIGCRVIDSEVGLLKLAIKGGAKVVIPTNNEGIPSMPGVLATGKLSAKDTTNEATITAFKKKISSLQDAPLLTAPQDGTKAVQAMRDFMKARADYLSAPGATIEKYLSAVEEKLTESTTTLETLAEQIKNETEILQKDNECNKVIKNLKAVQDIIKAAQASKDPNNKFFSWYSNWKADKRFNLTPANPGPLTVTTDALVSALDTTNRNEFQIALAAVFSNKPEQMQKFLKENPEILGVLQEKLPDLITLQNDWKKDLKKSEDLTKDLQRAVDTTSVKDATIKLVKATTANNTYEIEFVAVSKAVNGDAAKEKFETAQTFLSALNSTNIAKDKKILITQNDGRPVEVVLGVANTVTAEISSIAIKGLTQAEAQNIIGKTKDLEAAFIKPTQTQTGAIIALQKKTYENNISKTDAAATTWLTTDSNAATAEFAAIFPHEINLTKGASAKKEEDDFKAAITHAKVENFSSDDLYAQLSGDEEYCKRYVESVKRYIDVQTKKIGEEKAAAPAAKKGTGAKLKLYPVGLQHLCESLVRITNDNTRDLQGFDEKAREDLFVKTHDLIELIETVNTKPTKTSHEKKLIGLAEGIKASRDKPEPDKTPPQPPKTLSESLLKTIEDNNDAFTNGVKMPSYEYQIETEVIKLKDGTEKTCTVYIDAQGNKIKRDAEGYLPKNHGGIVSYVKDENGALKKFVKKDGGGEPVGKKTYVTSNKIPFHFTREALSGEKKANKNIEVTPDTFSFSNSLTDSQKADIEKLVKQEETARLAVEDYLAIPNNKENGKVTAAAAPKLKELDEAYKKIAEKLQNARKEASIFLHTSDKNATKKADEEKALKDLLDKPAITSHKELTKKAKSATRDWEVSSQNLAYIYKIINALDTLEKDSKDKEAKAIIYKANGKVSAALTIKANGTKLKESYENKFTGADAKKNALEILEDRLKEEKASKATMIEAQNAVADHEETADYKKAIDEIKKYSQNRGVIRLEKGNLWNSSFAGLDFKEDHTAAAPDKKIFDNGISLYGATFRNCNCVGVDFSGVEDLHTAKFVGCTFDKDCKLPDNMKQTDLNKSAKLGEGEESELKRKYKEVFEGFNFDKYATKGVKNGKESGDHGNPEFIQKLEFFVEHYVKGPLLDQIKSDLAEAKTGTTAANKKAVKLLDNLFAEENYKQIPVLSGLKPETRQFLQTSMQLGISQGFVAEKTVRPSASPKVLEARAANDAAAAKTH